MKTYDKYADELNSKDRVTRQEYMHLGMWWMSDFKYNLKKRFKRLFKR